MMDRVKIIEKMLAYNTGRPPTKLLKIVEYLMCHPGGVSVQRISTDLTIASSTIGDAFDRLKKLEYLSKENLNKEKYGEERYITKGKRDIHRLPYIYKLNDKFYTKFNNCQEDIKEDARDGYDDAKILFADANILSAELSIGIRSHIIPSWAGDWNTSFGLLEIKAGHPITGKYPNGKIKGEAIKGTLRGSWYEGTKSGLFEFNMSAGSSSFSGKRLSNINQLLCEWNGDRL
jgi:hypothetical protein